MTNKEWFKKRVKEASDEELIDLIEGDNCYPWCFEGECPTHLNCKICMQDWLEEIYPNPMPKLEVGMFIRCIDKNTKTPRFGIIVSQKCVGLPKHLCVAYQNGSWDNIDAVDITAIYDAMCFNHCGSETCIWRNE